MYVDCLYSFVCIDIDVNLDGLLYLYLVKYKGDLLFSTMLAFQLKPTANKTVDSAEYLISQIVKYIHSSF